MSNSKRQIDKINRSLAEKCDRLPRLHPFYSFWGISASARSLGFSRLALFGNRLCLLHGRRWFCSLAGPRAILEDCFCGRPSGALSTTLLVDTVEVGTLLSKKYLLILHLRMKTPILNGDFRFSMGCHLCPCSAERERGQALLETVMCVGFLVAIATVINKMLPPVVVEAFGKIGQALSSVGP